MALDDVIRSTENSAMLGDLAKRQSYAQDYSTYLSYRQASGIAPETLEREKVLLQNNPQALSLIARESLKQEQKRAVDTTRAHLGEILNSLGENFIQGYSFEIFGKNKEYEALMEAIQQNDYAGLKKHYHDKAKGDSIHDIILSYAQGEKLVEIASFDLRKTQAEFMRKNFYDMTKEKDEKGVERDVPKYNPEKAISYLQEGLNKMAKDKQEAAYYQIALAYAQKNSKR